jgi:hypothetical protein
MIVTYALIIDVTKYVEVWKMVYHRHRCYYW